MSDSFSWLRDRVGGGDLVRRSSVVGIRWAEADRLRRLRDGLGGLAGLTEGFYEALLRTPELAVFLESPGTLDRLRSSHRAYVQSFFEDDLSPDWVEIRLRTGYRHYNIGLEPAWYLGAYAWMVEQILPSAVELGVETVSAFLGRLFLDVSLVLEAYHLVRRYEVGGGAPDPPPADEPLEASAGQHLAQLGFGGPSLPAAYRFLAGAEPPPVFEGRAVVSSAEERAAWAALATRRLVDHGVVTEGEGGALRSALAGWIEAVGASALERRSAVGLVLRASRAEPHWLVETFGAMLQTALRSLWPLDGDELAATARTVLFDVALNLDVCACADLEALTDRADWARTVLSSTAIGLAVVSPLLRVVEVNPSFRALFDLGSRDVVGRAVDDLVPALELGARVRQGRTGPWVVDGRDGRRLQVWLSALGGEGSSGFRLLLARDLSELDRLRSDAAVSEQRFRHLVEGVDGVVFEATLAADGRLAFRYLSRRLEPLLGVSPEAWLAAPGAWLERVLPADRPTVAAHLSRLEANGASEAEYRLRHSDGRLVWVHDRSRRLGPGPEPSLLGLWVDVTERHRLEDQLLEAQKLESTGRLAGGLAHDFNNLMMIIGCNVDLIEERLSTLPDHGFGPKVQAIREATGRAADLTRQLMAFARRQVLSPSALDLGAVVDELRPLLAGLVGDEVELRCELEPGLPRILADRARVEQILVNLSLNARDAMPEGGVLTLRCRRCPGEGASLAGRLRCDHPAAAAVRLEMIDTGAGMDELTLAHVFEPFFTTKDVGRGSGMGLAAVYGIVHQSGGRIALASAPGGGTTVALCLPCGR